MPVKKYQMLLSVCVQGTQYKKYDLARLEESRHTAVHHDGDVAFFEACPVICRDSLFLLLSLFWASLV